MDKVFQAECELENFKVVYDEDALKTEITQMESYNEEGYVRIGTEETLTPEEYMTEVETFRFMFESNITDLALRNAIAAFPKKKNGTFKKNGVLAVKRLNASYYSDDEYGWACEELRFKAIDDNTLRLGIKRIVIHY